MSIQITKLNFSYPFSHTNLFEDFSLSIQDGWTCVAGSNGCGKSTLLKLIAGILCADGGKISAGGDSVYCAQDCSEIPGNLYNAFWSDDNEVRRFFSILCVTEEMLERYESLSGGEKKRIQIASALAENPAVLLLDEPTNHLDAKTKAMICSALKTFTGTGLIVSHDRDFADTICTKTIYLYNEASAFAGGRECTVFGITTRNFWRVVNHLGDSNIFVKDGKVSGFIDLGRSGRADKWYDIAFCVRSIREDIGEEQYVELFFDLLGIKPDWEKIKYYILLDELF